MKPITLIPIILAVAGASALSGYKMAPTQNEAYVTRRAWILTQEAQRYPTGQVLLIGDSLSERSGIVTLCDKPVFNAGISTAKLAEVDGAARELAKTLKPSLTLIALGSNDAQQGTDPVDFEAKLLSLARAVPKPLAIVQMSGGPLNAAMANVARKVGARLLVMPTYPTVDGVHQTPEGAAIWRSALSPACGGVGDHVAPNAISAAP